MGKVKYKTDYDDQFQEFFNNINNSSEFRKDFIKNSDYKNSSKKLYQKEAFNLSADDRFLDGTENPHNFRGGLDLASKDPFNELRSQRQGLFDTAATGLARVPAKVAREVLKLPGVVGGLIGGIAGNIADIGNNADGTDKDNMDLLKNTFNNGYIKSIDAAFDKLNKEVLPVYVSDAVTNGDFFDKVTSSEFYATEGADGLGYMISAIAPGAALKGLKAGEALFSGLSKVGSLRYAGNLEKFRKAITVAQDTEGLGASIAKKWTVDGINQIMIPAVNTFTEAGTEAAGHYNFREENKETAFEQASIRFKTQQDKKISDSKSKFNNSDRNYFDLETYRREENQFSNEVLDRNIWEKDYDAETAKGAASQFLKNTLILAVPNYIQSKLIHGLGKTSNLESAVLNAQSKATRAITQASKSAKVLAQEAAELAEKQASKGFFKSAGQRIAKIAENDNIKGFSKRLGQGFLSEGAEEVAQLTVENNTKKGDYSFNPLEGVNEFFKTLNTTEGQIAGFLGGVMGGPTNAFTGYKQHAAETKSTNDLADQIVNATTSINNLNLDRYKTESFINAEGKEDFRYKLSKNGKRIVNFENVKKIRESLINANLDSKDYDDAVKSGNKKRLENLKNKAEHDLILDFVGSKEITSNIKDTEGFEEFRKHLDVMFPKLNVSKSVAAENNARQQSLINKFESRQKDVNSFYNMTQSVVRLDNTIGTKEQRESFLNDFKDTFLTFRDRIDNNEKSLKEVNKKIEERKIELSKGQQENNNILSAKEEIKRLERSNTTEYNRRQSEIATELDDKIIEEIPDGNQISNDDEILQNLEKEKTKLNNRLNNQYNTVNKKAWNNDEINKTLKKRVYEENRLENLTSEVNDEISKTVLNDLNSATTQEEYRDIIKKYSKDDALDQDLLNGILYNNIEFFENLPTKEQVEKAEKDQKELNKAAKIEDEGVDETDLVNDDNLVQNNLEVDEILDEKEFVDDVSLEVDSNNKSGHMLMSLNKNFDLIFESLKSFAGYEKEPRDKSNDKITFEIADLPTNINGSFLKLLQKLKNKEKLTTEYIDRLILNRNYLENYLPIKVNLSNDKTSAFSYLRALTSAVSNNVDSLDIFNKKELPLRKSIIELLIQNNFNLDKIVGSVKFQGKGKLNLDVNGSNNNVLDLSVFTKFVNNEQIEMSESEKIDYIKKNTYIVNHNRQLVLASNKDGNPTTENFSNVKKSYQSGDVYLITIRPNGLKVPIKLNNNRLTNTKAEAIIQVLSLWSKLMKDSITIDTDFNNFLENNLSSSNFSEVRSEISLIPNELTNIEKFEKLINLIVFSQNNNEISKFYLDKDGNLILGSLLQKVNDNLNTKEGAVSYNSLLSEVGFTGFNYTLLDSLFDNQEEEISENKKIVLEHLKNYLIYKKTNIIADFNNDDYIKHVFGLNNNVALVSTNVATNKDMFEGYSNIFLNSTVSSTEDFNIPIVSDKVLDAVVVPEVEVVQNNQEEIRNVQEKVVSLLKSEKELTKKEKFEVLKEAKKLGFIPNSEDIKNIDKLIEQFKNDFSSEKLNEVIKKICKT